MGKPIKAHWNGPYVDHVPPLLERAKDLTLETLRKEVARLEEDASLGVNGSGDVSGPAAHSDTM